MDDDFAKLKARLVEIANELAEAGPIDARKLIDTHDVVAAVWQDAEEPDGVGMLLVKGDRALRTIVAENMSPTVTMAAIPCECAEMAVALKEDLGEPQAHD